MPSPRSQRTLLPIALVAAVIGSAAAVLSAAPGCFAPEPPPASAPTSTKSAEPPAGATTAGERAESEPAERARRDSGERTERDPGERAQRDPGERAQRDVVSNGGRYVLHVREPVGGWERGESLSFEVRVARAEDPTRTLADVALVVDADMPEHLHGLNRVPRVERLADGGFRVDAAYLHMPGWWEVFLDVVENSWTERAQMRVVIE